MKTDTEIVARMKQLEKTRPNVFGNMLLIGLLQLISFLGGIALLVIAAFILSTSDSKVEHVCKRFSLEIDFTNKALALICVLAGLLLLFINVLTKMINRRNAFLIEFLLVLDPDEKH